MKTALLGLSVVLYTLSLGADDVLKVSSLGFDKIDSTEYLQKALDSGAKKILVDNVGSPWITKPLFVKGDIEIIIGDDVVVQAKRGEFQNPQDCLFTVGDVKNVTFRGGKNAVLKMNKNDYIDKSQGYAYSEWRHGISLRGAENVTIDSLTIESSGGDGIYVGTSSRSTGIPSRNITISNSVLKDNHRQGCSVISVENLLIDNCDFIDTLGTPPQCGLDFEPNNPHEVLINCVVQNSRFKNNAWSGILLALGPLNQTTKPISITFKNCDIRDNKSAGIYIYAGNTNEGQAPGFIKFIQCKVTEKGGDAVIFMHQQNKGFMVEFTDVIIDNGQNGGKAAFVINSGNKNDIGNIDFGNTLVVANNYNQFRVGGIGAAGIVDLRGKITIDVNGNRQDVNLKKVIDDHKPNLELKSFASEPLKRKSLRPVEMQKGAPSNPIRLRLNNTFVQYVPANGVVPISFDLEQVGGAAPKAKINITDVNGTSSGTLEFNSAGRHNYELKSAPGGFYFFEINAGGHTLKVNSNAPGQGILVDNRARFFRSNGNFFFVVPKDTESVKLEIWAEEPTSAILLNAAGVKVDEVANLANGVKIFSVERTKSNQDEIWELKLMNCQEDYGLRLGTPCLPILFSSKENIIGIE